MVELIENNGGRFCDRCSKLRRVKFINTPRVPQRRYYCQNCYKDADLEVLASGWSA
jgi:late competence protein required for DNA uptake (superfamily II DNA/RNA helicase)